MKKIILSLVSVLFLFSTASADIGLNVGISGTTALFVATGNETQTDADGNEGTTKQEDTEMGAGGYASIFIEKEFGRFAIGYNHTPEVFSTETAETLKRDQQTANVDTVTVATNTVQVDFDEMNQVYVKAMVTDNLYIRAGAMSVDVKTNESLGTGSAYGDTSLDGTSFGLGYHKELDNTLFIRVDGQYMSFDGVTLSSLDNTLNLKNLNGVTATLSVGKSF
jgi:hypothetical protein